MIEPVWGRAFSTVCGTPGLVRDRPTTPRLCDIYAFCLENFPIHLYIRSFSIKLVKYFSRKQNIVTKCVSIITINITTPRDGKHRCFISYYLVNILCHALLLFNRIKSSHNIRIKTLGKRQPHKVKLTAFSRHDKTAPGPKDIQFFTSGHKAELAPTLFGITCTFKTISKPLLLGIKLLPASSSRFSFRSFPAK